MAPELQDCRRWELPSFPAFSVWDLSGAVLAKCVAGMGSWLVLKQLLGFLPAVQLQEWEGREGQLLTGLCSSLWVLAGREIDELVPLNPFSNGMS